MLPNTIAMIFGVAATVIALVIYVPYGLDIVSGRVIPSRSSRVMLTLILIIALLQQYSLGAGWALGVTAGELIGALAILGLSMRHGMGGYTRIDVVCYVLFALSIAVWLGADNPLLALHVSILADFIAFAPTLIKSWRYPHTETPLFYGVGTLAAVFSAIASNSLRYAVIVFPLYLALVNLVQLLVMYRPSRARG